MEALQQLEDDVDGWLCNCGVTEELFNETCSMCHAGTLAESISLAGKCDITGDPWPVYMGTCDSCELCFTEDNKFALNVKTFAANDDDENSLNSQDAELIISGVWERSERYLSLEIRYMKELGPMTERSHLSLRMTDFISGNDMLSDDVHNEPNDPSVYAVSVNVRPITLWMYIKDETCILTRFSNVNKQHSQSMLWIFGPR